MAVNEKSKNRSQGAKWTVSPRATNAPLTKFEVVWQRNRFLGNKQYPWYTSMEIGSFPTLLSNGLWSLITWVRINKRHENEVGWCTRWLHWLRHLDRVIKKGWGAPAKEAFHPCQRSNHLRGWKCKHVATGWAFGVEGKQNQTKYFCHVRWKRSAYHPKMNFEILFGFPHLIEPVMTIWFTNLINW